MPASKLNYVVVYEGVSQVYGCSSKKIALETPPPSGVDISKKKVLFITFEPDTDNLCVYEIKEESDDKETNV